MAEDERTIDAACAAQVNRRFYDALWSRARLVRPERFNTWPLIQELLPFRPLRLEVGPGLRPRIPIAGSHFVDQSPEVIARLNERGAVALSGAATELPFADASFDLVCAFDVIEHVEDDQRAFAELGRVLRPGGVLVFSVPIHPHLWSPFDLAVGHVRRYDPILLILILLQHKLLLEKSAPFGMQPGNRHLVRLGMWFMAHRPKGAFLWYNRLFLPVHLLFQKTLKFSRGLIDTRDASGIVMVCRRCGTSACCISGSLMEAGNGETSQVLIPEGFDLT